MGQVGIAESFPGFQLLVRYPGKLRWHVHSAVGCEPLQYGRFKINLGRLSERALVKYHGFILIRQVQCSVRSSLAL